MLNSLNEIENPPTPAADGYNNGVPFGPWPGTRNGWTTRNTVLAAQALTTAQGAAADAVVGNGNNVVSGTWQQPYDTTAGSPATPVVSVNTTKAQIGSNLQVDHVVPAAYAWITGADMWPIYNTPITITQGTQIVSTTQGMQMLYDFSNDLSGAELLIVGSLSNSTKGGNGPQGWMPYTQECSVPTRRCGSRSSGSGTYRSPRHPPLVHIPRANRRDDREGRSAIRAQYLLLTSRAGLVQHCAGKAPN